MKLSTFNFPVKEEARQRRQLSTPKGFTLIELLVVIALISILATSFMVLINPLEQVSRGRDTANTSDARQLIDAINRFYANKGYYPWQTSATLNMSTGAVEVGDSWVNDAAIPAKVLAVLSDNTSGGAEINSSFVNKVTSSNYNKLYVYNGSASGSPNQSTYVCFKPQSKLFLEKAKTKWGSSCGNMSTFSDIGAGSGPSYAWGSLITICDSANNLYATCLP